MMLPVVPSHSSALSGGARKVFVGMLAVMFAQGAVTPIVMVLYGVMMV
jgi:hypothetical protein